MGALFSSNRMSRSQASASDPVVYYDEHEVTNLLQYFLRSEQIPIRMRPSLELYESDEDFFRRIQEIFVEEKPDTSCIENSDIASNIKLRSGTFNNRMKSDVHLVPICSMLNMRETGMKKSQQFTFGDKCQINKRFLPNKMQIVDHFNSKVFCGSFAKDGNIFMSASQDYYIRLYNTQTSEFKLTKSVEARDVGWSILDVAVSPDGSHFVYCSWSECIHMCNVDGEKDVHDALPLYPDQERFCIFALRFSHDGNEILGGANDECLYVYNRERNMRTLKINAHEDDVNTVAFADSTSHIIFSGGDDGLCKVWDRRMLCESDPKPVGIFVGHEDGITYVDPKGDGRYLITNSKDQTIKLWDMRKFSPSSSLQASRKAVQSHNWDYRWQRVPVSLNRAKRKLPGDTSLMTYRGHSVLQTLIRCHFSPEHSTGQQYIYTGCSQGRVVLYDVLTGKIKADLFNHSSCVRDVDWHPYRNEIISSSWDGVVGKWTYFAKLSMDSDSDTAKSDSDYEIDSDNSDIQSFTKVRKLRRSKRLAMRKRKLQL